MFFSLITILILIFTAISWLGIEARTPIWRIVSLALFAHLIYAGTLLLAWKRKVCVNIFWIVGIALVLRVVLIPSPPVFSDDIYRYIWDGRTLLLGANPYDVSPIASAAPTDPVWQHINNKELRTIYPPMAEMIFGLVAFVSPTVTGFKIASALFDISVVALVFLLAGGRLNRSAQAEVTPVLASLTYALNPLACIESAGSGHLDSMAVATTALAVLLVIRGRPIVAGTVLGLATGIKVLPALLLPFMRPKRVLAALVCAAVLMGLYLPFLSAGRFAFESMDTYARRWELNSGVFEVTKDATSAALKLRFSVKDPSENIHLRFMDPVAKHLQGTFFSLHKEGGWDPKKPGKFTLGTLSRAIARIILGAVFIAVLVVTGLRQRDPILAATIVFGTLIVLSPVLHPWYLLWVLPFAAVSRVWPFMILAALSTLAYLPLDHWWKEGVWVCPPWIPALMWGAFFAAMLAFLYRRYRGNQPTR